LRRRNDANIVAASHPVRSADEFDEADIRSKHSRDSRALRSLADAIATRRSYYSYYGDQRAYRERYPAVRIFTRVSSRGCVQRVTKTFPDKFARRFPAHNGLGDVLVQIAAEHSSRPSRCVSPRMRYEIRGNVLMYERAARRRSMVDKCAVGSEGFVKCRSRS